MIIHYEYDKDYHYDLDDRVDNIWLRATGGGESVLCFGRRFQGSGGSGRGQSRDLTLTTGCVSREGSRPHWTQIGRHQHYSINIITQMITRPS